MITVKQTNQTSKREWEKLDLLFQENQRIERTIKENLEKINEGMASLGLNVVK